MSVGTLDGASGRKNIGALNNSTVDRACQRNGGVIVGADIPDGGNARFQGIHCAADTLCKADIVAVLDGIPHRIRGSTIPDKVDMGVHDARSQIFAGTVDRVRSVRGFFVQ